MAELIITITVHEPEPGDVETQTNVMTTGLPMGLVGKYLRAAVESLQYELRTFERVHARTKKGRPRSDV